MVGGRSSKLLPLWFLLPAIIVLVLLQVGPTLYSFYLSFTHLSLDEVSNKLKLDFVGLDNYLRLANSASFTHSLSRTAIYSLWYVVLTISLGLLLALLLNRGIRFTRFYLIVLFIPWVISDIVAGTIWRWLFQQTYGIVQVWLNPILGASLLTTPNGAMAVVVAASVWRSLAFTTLLFLAALQTVPREILESAAIDGANRFRRFLYVIFPIIRSTVLVVLLLTSIRAINTVGLIFAITKGEPGGATVTTSYYLLRTGWEQGEFGLGAAISVSLFVINMILTIFYLRLVGSKEA
jgi:multiple sugar transport system permease protein